MGAGSLCSPSFVLAPFLLLSLRSWNGGTNERRVLKRGSNEVKGHEGDLVFWSHQFLAVKGVKELNFGLGHFGVLFLFIYLFILNWVDFGGRFGLTNFWCFG